MDQSNRRQVWASGVHYEPFIGRWSRLVAREFVAWLSAPAQSRWLDVGCGTGALSEAIAVYADPAALTGVDPSPDYLLVAQESLSAGVARFLVGDAQHLPVETAAFDATVAGLVLNFVSDPGLAAVEMARATRCGGTVAAYVWDYAGEMQLLRRFWDAATILDPAAAALDEGRRFPLCRPEPLAALFRAAGLAEVEVRAVEVATIFRDFDDYWTPFLGGQGPAPSYITSLDADRRAALREQLRASLPIQTDGVITLLARAWAVRGRRE